MIKTATSSAIILTLMMIMTACLIEMTPAAWVSQSGPPRAFWIMTAMAATTPLKMPTTTMTEWQTLMIFVPSARRIGYRRQSKIMPPTMMAMAVVMLLRMLMMTVIGSWIC